MLGNPSLPRVVIIRPVVYPLNLKIRNQEKNIPVGLPSSPIKILGKSVKGFLSYDRTDKQRLQLYIYIHWSSMHSLLRTFCGYDYFGINRIPERMRIQKRLRNVIGLCYYNCSVNLFCYSKNH